MLIAPRNIPSACLLRRGMLTIFLRLGIFQPAKWGIFNRRKLGNIQPALTLDHYHEQYPAFIPTAQPAHSPATQVIAHLDRPTQSQEFGFNLHSPLRTCSSAGAGSQLAIPRLLTNRASVRIHSGRQIFPTSKFSPPLVNTERHLLAEMDDICPMAGRSQLWRHPR